MNEQINEHMNKQNQTRTAPRWLTLLLGLGCAWGLLIPALSIITDNTPESWAFFLSVLFSGLYTGLLLLTRRLWLPLAARHPIRNATLLSIFNAIVVETIFWMFQHLTGAEDLAAHPNLILDLVLTMPWYILLAITFVRVQNRQRFAPAVVLLLGGLYEIGGDGIVGPAINILEGNNMLCTPGYWIQIALLHVWVFVIVYSALVLPPTWIIAQAPRPEPPHPPVWLDILKPLVWLIPVTIYLAIWLLILSETSGL